MAEAVVGVAVIFGAVVAYSVWHGREVRATWGMGSLEVGRVVTPPKSHRLKRTGMKSKKRRK